MSKRGDSVSASTRILAFMHENPGRVWRGAAIADRLDIAKPTARQAFRRLLQNQNGTHPPLLRVEPGKYRLFQTAGAIFGAEPGPILLHALGFRCTASRNRGWSPPGGRQRRSLEIGDLRAPSGWDWSPENRQNIKRSSWLGRDVTVQVSESGTVLVQVCASQPEENLTPSDLERCLSWLDGLLLGEGLEWSQRDARLVSVEMHRHFQRFRMHASVQGMTLQLWRNAWAQVYQKEEGLLRAELRWNEGSQEISLSEAVALLRALQGPGARP